MISEHIDPYIRFIEEVKRLEDKKVTLAPTPKLKNIIEMERQAMEIEMTITIKNSAGEEIKISFEEAEELFRKLSVFLNKQNTQYWPTTYRTGLEINELVSLDNQ